LNAQATRSSSKVAKPVDGMMQVTALFHFALGLRMVGEIDVGWRISDGGGGGGGGESRVA